MTLSIRRLQGGELHAALPDLARLRIDVFKAFPYLYDGSVGYEQKYLEVYTKSPRCAVIAAYDENKMVGAATALPLSDENDYIQKPFIESGFDLDKVFYFGESVLLPDYRGQGIGHVFFDEREKVAHSYPGFKWTCFCAVQRPADHPLRPSNYQPLDEFWKKRGYAKTDRLQSYFSWKDLNQTEETEKPMTYWLKEIL